MRLLKLNFGKNPNYAVSIHLVSLVSNVDLITSISRFPADHA